MGEELLHGDDEPVTVEQRHDRQAQVSHGSSDQHNRLLQRRMPVQHAVSLDVEQLGALLELGEGRAQGIRMDFRDDEPSAVLRVAHLKANFDVLGFLVHRDDGRLAPNLVGHQRECR